MIRTAIHLELVSNTEASSCFVLRQTIAPNPTYEQVREGIMKGCTADLLGFAMNIKTSGCKKPKFSVEIADNNLHVTIRYHRECKREHLAHLVEHLALVSLHPVEFQAKIK